MIAWGVLGLYPKIPPVKGLQQQKVKSLSLEAFKKHVDAALQDMV